MGTATGDFRRPASKFIAGAVSSARSRRGGERAFAALVGAGLASAEGPALSTVGDCTNASGRGAWGAVAPGSGLAGPCSAASAESVGRGAVFGAAVNWGDRAAVPG